MSDAFTLEVPADARFSEIAPAVAGRYVEIIGGTEADRDACETRVAAVVRELDPDPGASIEIRFTPGPQGLEISAVSAGKSRVVTHPLPAKAK